MPIRLRKFIGTIALIILVVMWALVAMALAQAPFIFDNMIASIAYYVIAGIGWVLPAMPIVSWMSGRVALRPHPGGGTRSTSPSPIPTAKPGHSADVDIHR